MSKNIATKPVAINSSEVWMTMSKGNFLRKRYGRLQYSAMLVKQISLWTNLRSILNTIKCVTKIQKTK